MTTFVEFSLPADAVPLTDRILDAFDVTVELERVVPTGSAPYHVWVVGPDAERAASALADDHAGGRVVSNDPPDRSLVRLAPAGDPPALFAALASTDAMLVEAVGTRDGWSVTGRFGGPDAASSFRDACRERGLALEPRDPDADAPASALDGPTRAEREALQVAFEAGYFDVPRDATLAELADRLDASEREAAERIRRALTALLDRSLRTDDPAVEE